MGLLTWKLKGIAAGVVAVASVVVVIGRWAGQEM
jgi:hypothetical protein